MPWQPSLWCESRGAPPLSFHKVLWKRNRHLGSYRCSQVSRVLRYLGYRYLNMTNRSCLCLWILILVVGKVVRGAPWRQMRLPGKHMVYLHIVFRAILWMKFHVSLSTLCLFSTFSQSSVKRMRIFVSQVFAEMKKVKIKWLILNIVR